MIEFVGERLARFPVLCAFAGSLALLSIVASLLAPAHLFFFDSVNFALALDYFDPLRHQPQPPGYPLYVALTRLVRLFAPSVESVFLVAGVAGGCTASVLIFLLGRMLFGWPAGLIAATLFAFHPVLWFSLLTNQVRIFLAVVGTGVAALAWLTWTRPQDSRWLPLTGLAFGLGAGFRPALLVQLMPLFLLTLWIRRGNPRNCFRTAALFAAGVALWLLPVLARTGGWAPFVAALEDYSRQQFSGTSPLYGAAAPAAAQMAIWALTWNGAGILRWIWALPLALRRRGTEIKPRHLLLLAVWFVPPFLFHSLVHVGDPDHVLITVPVLSLLGGWMLAAAFTSRDARVLAAGLSVLAGMVLFFKPPANPFRAFSYRVVRYVDAHTRSTMSEIARAQRSGPLQAIVWNDGFVSWRTIGYYHPNVPIYAIHGNGTDAPWIVRGNSAEPLAERTVKLPSGSRVLLTGKVPEQMERELMGAAVERSGSVLAVAVRPGMKLTWPGLTIESTGD